MHRLTRLNNPFYGPVRPGAVEDFGGARSVLQPLQGNFYNPLGPDTVQARIEVPEVGRSGAIMGGIVRVGGALSIYGGIQDENPYLSTLGITSGSLEVTGELVSAVGAFRASAPLMRVGARLMVVGSVLTSGVGAIEDWKERDYGGSVLNVASVASAPAAILNAAYHLHKAEMMAYGAILKAGVDSAKMYQMYVVGAATPQDVILVANPYQ